MNGRFSFWILAAGILGATGIGLSAWTSHGLPQYVTDVHALQIAEARAQSANLNLLLHAVLLFAIGVWRRSGAGWFAALAGALILLGMALFSGGMYLLYIFNDMSSSPMTRLVPVGGFSVIAGWLCLSVSAWSNSSCTD